MRSLTSSQKTVLLVKWIQRKFKKRPSSTRTTEVLAALATEDLGFRITPNKMCRELRREGIGFKPSPNDPRPQNYSKVDLLRARVDIMEERMQKLEKGGRKKNN